MSFRSERSDKGTIVYVGGLEAAVQKEELEKEFEKFGKLARVWVAFNPPGFAFVEFDNKDDAESAVSALHNNTLFGTRLRVEISRGRGRGGRGGGGRGGPRGRDDSDFPSRSYGGFGGRDFRGRGGSDFGRGRGRGGFSGGHPFERDEPMKPFRGGDMGGRFDDRRRGDFEDRGFGSRDFGARNDFRDAEGPRGFGDSRNGGRDYPSRGVGERNFPTRDMGDRDFSPRDLGGRGFGPRDLPERDFGLSRDMSMRGARDFGGRDFGEDRPVNGGRGFADEPVNRGFGGRDSGVGRNFSQNASLPVRDFGGPRDVGPVREVPVVRDFPDRDVMAERGGFGAERGGFGAERDIGMRREGIRDFNPPRDLNNPRDFGGRPSRTDYADTDRFPPGGRGGFGKGRAAGFDGAQFAGGDVGGSGDYGGFGGARDRFRSRSPIGRVSRPMY